jgi:hypothetical protein
MFADALRDGDSFAWTSQMFNGFYVHAEGQVGAFHPFHLFLYRFVPLTTAFNVEVIGSYIFAFAGMWLLLQRIGSARSPLASARWRSRSRDFRCCISGTRTP